MPEAKVRTACISRIDENGWSEWVTLTPPLAAGELVATGFSLDQESHDNLTRFLSEAIVKGVFRLEGS